MIEALLIALPVLAANMTPAPNAVVRIATSMGAIEVEVDERHAPATAANFLRYVDAGRYVGGRFHRTVTMQNQPDKKIKIEVIQAGVNPAFVEKDFPPIKLERTSVTGLKHLNGTISLARDGADTATSDFFICINDQPELDFGGKRNPDGQGFAAFGQVRSGMDVVRKIQQCAEKDQTLSPPIWILRIERVKAKVGWTGAAD